MAQGVKPVGTELKKYITDNIDRAVEERWITVFYQPVVRTLTGEVCGMEALARWIDPEFGMISPLEFIGTLEEAKLIHKLDSCVIRRICEDFARTSGGVGANAGTVSFNLSRLDFSLCDIHQVIEEAIKKNKVPRESLRIEITESTMETDSALMHDVIDRFWERGLRVWMDDFGSGYSSLNVLKDYHFDTLKIDMVFLRSFDPRSREIIRSVVDMAKRLGIHTLAEGVETEEQLEFLRNIGCEKAQGYYIGKPMPYDECYRYLKDKDMTIESSGKRQYFHDIGRVNLLSATPLDLVPDDERNLSEHSGQIPIAIVEMSGENDDITYLFANEAYKKVNLNIGSGTIEEIEREYAEALTEVKNKFTSLLNKAKTTGETVMADFVKNSHYCYSKVRHIADYPGGSAFLVVLQDMTSDEFNVKTYRLNVALMSICNIYDNIVEVDLNTGYSVGIYNPNVTKGDYHKRPASEELRQYASEEIYPEDIPGYLEFMDLSTLEERLEKTSLGHISAPFRTRTANGSYIWMLYSFIVSGRPSERKFLACMRKLPETTIARLYGDRNRLFEKLNEEEKGPELSPEVLWKNFVNNADTAFFWKDTDRRYLGANRKFLDYYGFDSDEVLKGRTDEEMGWRIDTEQDRAEEERIIEKGEQTFLVPCKCICKGEIKDTVASKYPIYRDGRIVGIMGYFLDITDWNSRMFKQNPEGDPEDRDTRNFMGMMEYALQYQTAYRQSGQDFSMAILNVTNIEKYRKDYGNVMVDELLERVGKRMQAALGNRGVAGRAGSGYFIILRQTRDRQDMEELISRVISAGEEVKEAGGIPCTPYLKAGFGFYSEAGSFQNLYHLSISRLREK